MGYDFASRFIKCPKCGHDVFVCYPQTMSLDKTKTQIWEYTCAKCKHCVAIKVKDWRDEE